MKDFIIVGHGLAANVLMHRFHANQISFATIGNTELSKCSRVAAGIWNPVVFKRATKSWMAEELIKELNIFYSECESNFGKKIVTQRNIIKPFVQEQEKELWRKKSRTDLIDYIDGEVHHDQPNELMHCNVQHGYGVVKHCGNLNVSAFIDYSSTYFKEQIIYESFDHRQLSVLPNKVSYRDVQAKHIIFCEGYCVKDNIFFNWIPLKPAKGEVLTIETEKLNLNNQIFNKNGFLMDLRPGIFSAGATYEWQDLSEHQSEQGLSELKSKLHDMINCDYHILRHDSGIRPSSIDRRPLIGSHPVHKNLFVFNGLGTKGVMLAPYFAKKFVNFYLQKEKLNPEVDISRFYRLYNA
jgi:glycine oxidase